LPGLGPAADLLGKLAPAGVERRLALLVELAGRDLEHVRVVGRLARLADQPDVALVDGHHADGAGVADDLAGDLLAVGIAIALAVDGHDRALEDPFGRQPLEIALAHERGIIAARAVPAASAAATKSGSSRPIDRVGPGYAARSTSTARQSWRSHAASRPAGSATVTRPSR